MQKRFSMGCIRTIVEADVAYPGILDLLSPKETKGWRKDELKDVPCVWKWTTYCEGDSSSQRI